MIEYIDQSNGWINPNRDKRNNLEFYRSRAWKHLRQIKIHNDPVCERCNVKFAKHIHHRVELSDAPHLALDLENLESLCISCHTTLHNDQRKQKNEIPTWKRKT